MKPRRFRSGIITATIIALAAAAWLFFAPTGIGGSTTYVVTSGISMEPHFHTGDLALVRPTDHYRVGDVVAYRSSLLHVAVLHRIVAIRDGHYTFKGDNNNFLDPVHPTRAQLIGVLWAHLPQGGRVLKWIHSPVTAAVLCGFVALLLFGTGEARRRRNQRRNGSRPRTAKTVKIMDRATPLAPSLRALLVAFATATVACVFVVGYAATRPGTKIETGHLSYTQHAGFTYHAAAPAGSVYPSGTVATGDPIFLALVHRVGFKVSYRLSSGAPQRLSGTAQVSLNLTGPTGWTRTMPLSPLRHFSGGRITLPGTLDLRALQSLLLDVQKETGIPDAAGFTVGIALHVHVDGTLAGRSVDAKFAPVATFQLQPQELEPTASAALGAAAAGAGTTSGSGGLTPSQNGSLSIQSVVPDPLSVAGHDFSWDAIEWAGVAGFVLSALATVLLAVLLQRNRAFDEAARIRARYGHLLVPIMVGEDLGWPPVDVTSFKALARLAESAGQLVLHHQADAVDTYLVNDSGTVYRYQIKLPLVTWGAWTETNVAAQPVALDAATALAGPAGLADTASTLADPATLADVASALADVAAPADVPA